MQAEEGLHHTGHYQLSQYEKDAKRWELPMPKDYECVEPVVYVLAAPTRNEWKEGVATKEDDIHSAFECQVIGAPLPHLGASLTLQLSFCLAKECASTFKCRECLPSRSHSCHISRS